MVRVSSVVVVLSGCVPTLTGSDQVPDIDVNFVASADQALTNGKVQAADDVIDDLLAAHPEAGGCALGLVVDGEILHLEGYGDAEPGVPYGTGTMSPVGSVSKTFTALAIEKLVDAGDVNLDSPADTYLPVDEELGDATIRSLLTHASGAPRDVSIAGEDPEDMVQPALAYAAYAPGKTLTDLGGDTAYSNVGYAVLGAVIDALSPDGYEAYVWSEVARGTLLTGGSPSLALVHSWRETDIPNLAEGYSSAGDPFPTWEDVGTVEGWEGPPGGWALTIGDFARMVSSIQDREIVTPDRWTELTGRPVWVDGRAYGFGMWTEGVSSSGSKRLNHGGDIGGYTAFWASYEVPGASSFGVALQCNFEKGSGALGGAADDLYDAFVAGDIFVEADAFNAAPVGAPAVNGKKYAIDLSKGTAAPLGVPASELLGTLTLTVAQPRGSKGLDLTLADTKVGVMTPAVWKAAPFTADPAFGGSSIASLKLPLAAGGALKIEGAVLSGRFGPAGKTIEQLSLSGNLDTRSIPTTWTAGADACAEAALLGAACVRCADGVTTCAPVHIDGWTGSL